MDKSIKYGNKMKISKHEKYLDSVDRNLFNLEGYIKRGCDITYRKYHNKSFDEIKQCMGIKSNDNQFDNRVCSIMKSLKALTELFDNQPIDLALDEYYRNK